jgi:hypothetical protein
MGYFCTLLMSFIFFFAVQSRGALSLPTGMSDADQLNVLKEIGFATAFRPENNPFPLGGYSGLEFGVSIEELATSDIGYLGNGASDERTVFYPALTFGKGIFDNVDLFFSFVPYNQGTGLGIYSGGARWGFYQADFAPVVFSILVSGGATNLDNLFFSETIGADLIAGANADPFSFYIGVGGLYGQGQFDSSITVENALTNQSSHAFHTLFGATFTISPIFVAVELDNYGISTMSFKLGAKF